MMTSELLVAPCEHQAQGFGAQGFSVYILTVLMLKNWIEQAPLASPGNVRHS